LLVHGGWARDWDETVMRDLPTHRVP